jgi:hypothetical protein
MTPTQLRQIRKASALHHLQGERRSHMAVCRYSLSRFPVVCAACVLLIAAARVGGICLGQADTDSSKDQSAEESSRAQREARLAQMRERVVAIDVERNVQGERRRIPLHGEPLFRYSDQPRGLIDATLWSWGTTGRPVALAKVESAVTAEKTPYWQYCVTSLADGPVEFSFGNGRSFAAKKPGLELRKFDGAPPPDDRPAGRLRQMKELIVRFSGTIHAIHVGKSELQKQEMRLLPSPIHRYADEKAAITDGVIFALSTNGTNPDMLVLIELRGDVQSAQEWHYAIVKMTYSEVHIRGPSSK